METLSHFQKVAEFTSTPTVGVRTLLVKDRAPGGFTTDPIQSLIGTAKIAEPYSCESIIALIWRIASGEKRIDWLFFPLDAAHCLRIFLIGGEEGYLWMKNFVPFVAFRFLIQLRSMV
jgi:hypothetical protein